MLPMPAAVPSAAVEPPSPAPRSRTFLAAVLLLAGLAVLGLVSLVLGAVPVSLADLQAIIFPPSGLPTDEAERLTGLGFILLHIRLPRILAAIGAGAALAASGAAMQGLFRNPMAGPDILGVSAGSSLGALLAIATGLAGAFILALPLCALAGALATGFFVFSLSRAGRATSLLRVLLAGLAVSSLVGGIISAILMFSPVQDLKQFIFWTMGGLDGRTWDHVAWPALPLVLSLAGIFLSARRLDILALGEEQAFSAGLDVERFKVRLLLLAALACAMAVVMAGPVAFVGLMVPHMIRIIQGPRHRGLIVLSILAGADFLLAADLLGRCLAPPYEIKAGIITALVGGPYFLWLVWHDQRRKGW